MVDLGGALMRLLLALTLLLIAAPAANAYELDAADKRVPLPTHDWRYLQQQCEDYSIEEYGPIGCAYYVEWDDDRGHGRDAEVHLPKGMGASGYWHETGHLFDFTVLTDAHRAEFKRILGIPASTEWWTEIPEDTVALHHSYNPPGELFADAYSLCALRATGRSKLVGASIIPLLGRYANRVDWPNVEIRGGSYDYVARWGQHQRVCQMIGNAAGMHYNRKTGTYR